MNRSYFDCYLRIKKKASQILLDRIAHIVKLRDVIKCLDNVRYYVRKIF